MTRAGVVGPEPRIAAALSTFYFVSFAALGLFSPYFPLWLDSHGFTGARLGMVAALGPALSFLGPPLVGLLSDARGARGNLLGAACALACSGMLALCASEALGLSRSFAIVFVAVLGYAACRAPVVLIADRLTIEHGGSYGRRRVWGSVGYMLAATAFGRLCPPGALRWLPGWVALALALAFVTSQRLPRASSVPRVPALSSARGVLGQRGFALFLAGAALSAASHSSYDLCAPLFFRDLGASSDTIGLLYGTAVLAEVVLMGFCADRLRRFDPRLLLGIAYAGAALRWLCLSLLGSTSLGFVLQPLHAVSFGLMWMSSLEYVRRVSDPHTLGSAQGAFMAANAAGGVIGMLLWGPLYASHGGAFVFVVAAALSAAATLLGARNWGRGAATVPLHAAP